MHRATSIKTRTFKPQEGDAIDGFRFRRSRAFLVRLRDRLIGFFNRIFEEQGIDPLGRFQIRDQRGAVTVRVEMPGFQAEELDVNVRRNLLIVRALKPIETTGNRHEIDDLSFQESYDCAYLPSSVDAVRAEATYCDGVLTVNLPKAETRRVGRAFEDSRTCHPAPAARVVRGTQRWLRSDSVQWTLRAFEHANRPLNTKHVGNVRHCG